MKKIIALFLTALMLVNVSGCGDDKNTADSYADKLASGEIKPKIDKSDSDSSKKSGKKKKDKTDSKKEKKFEKPEEESIDKTEGFLTEKPTQEINKMKKTDSVPQPAEEKETSSATEEPMAGLPLSNAQMGALIDAFDDEYKSFEVVGIQSPDFYMGKTLKLAAVIVDHNLSQVLVQNIRATFSPQQLAIMSPDESGKDLKAEYYVYSYANSVLKTPSGRDFVYVTYGGAEPNGGSVDGVVGMIARVVCSNPETMGDAKADEYIVLVESGQPDAYQLFMLQ